MDILLEYGIPFVLGVFSSLVAAQLYAKIPKYMHKQLGVGIEGVWGEYAPRSDGRNYTVGKIARDDKRDMYTFDGTNYTNAGKAYCHFETVASYLDMENKRFYYIFSAQVEGNFEKVYSGFGVINLIVDDENRLVPADGFYLSASVDTQAMTHTMQRLEGVAYKRDQDAAMAIRLIKKN